MKKGSFRLKTLIMLIVFISAIVNIDIFHNTAYAATPGSTTVHFPESVGSTKTKTITIPNLYRVTSATVDNGYVTTSVNGNQLTITVYGGNYINYDSRWNSRKYSKYVSQPYSTSGSCVDDGSPDWDRCAPKSSEWPSSISYNQGGYSGTLYETSYNYSQTNYDWGFTYRRTGSYGGMVYKGGWEYYNYTYAYTVNLTYETNIKPKVSLDKDYSTTVLADYPGYSSITFSGYVEDQDNDTVTVSIKVNGKSKSQSINDTLTSKPFSIDFDVLNDDLKNGNNTVQVFADDGTGAVLVKTFNIQVKDIVEDGKYVLVDELLFYLTQYQDEEGDPLYKEQFMYEHDETFFENSLGRISDHGQWRNTPYNALTKTGHYKIYYRAMDNPKNDSRFDEFRKWSKPSPALNLYVHRKPVSDFEPYLEYRTGRVAIIDKAYDLDSYSQGRKGIQEATYRYREVGQSTWTDGRPYSLDPNKNYEIEQTVWDFQGVSASSIRTVIKVGTLPNVPPVPGFNHDSPYYIGDTIELRSTAYDGDGDPLTYRYVITKPDGNTIEYKTGDSELDEKTGNLTFKVSNPSTDVGLWQVVQYVDDNVHLPISYTQTIEVRNLTIEGFVKHTPKWQQIHLEKGNAPDEFYSGEKFVLSALVSNYPTTKVHVEMLGEQNNGKTLTLSTDLTKHPTLPLEYNGELFDPVMLEPQTALKEGSTVTFSFTAEFQNGYVTPTYEVEVKIIGNAYEVFRFHRSY